MSGHIRRVRVTLSCGDEFLSCTLPIDEAPRDQMEASDVLRELLGRLESAPIESLSLTKQIVCDHIAPPHMSRRIEDSVCKTCLDEMDRRADNGFQVAASCGSCET